MRVLYPDLTEIWGCWFLWREENRRTWRKTLVAIEGARTKNKLNPHKALGQNQTQATLVGGERYVVLGFINNRKGPPPYPSTAQLIRLQRQEEEVQWLCSRTLQCLQA